MHKPKVLGWDHEAHLSSCENVSSQFDLGKVALADGFEEPVVADMWLLIGTGCDGVSAAGPWPPGTGRHFIPPIRVWCVLETDEKKKISKDKYTTFQRFEICMFPPQVFYSWGCIILIQIDIEDIYNFTKYFLVFTKFFVSATVFNIINKKTLEPTRQTTSDTFMWHWDWSNDAENSALHQE